MRLNTPSTLHGRMYRQMKKMTKPSNMIIGFLCMACFELGTGEIFRQNYWNKTDFAKCRREDFQYWESSTRKCYHHNDSFVPADACGNDEFRCRRLAIISKNCTPRSYPDGCYDKQQNIIPCRKNEFTCLKSRRCLPRWSVSDNETDCSSGGIDDDTDETVGPYKSCEANEFRCHQSGRCIPRQWVMDGFNDCPKVSNSTTLDTSDEDKPLPYCKEKTEFLCRDSSRCISRYRVKDNYRDCVDGLDEIVALPNCNDEEYRCNDTGRCIPRSWIKDGIKNCQNGADEKNDFTYSCNGKEFSCHNGRRCIPKLYLCDGMDHCGDCSDEVEACDEARMWRCPNDHSRCITQSYGCDLYPDCPEYADTMSFMPGFKCDVEESRVYCAIPQWSLNDSLSTCTDRSDVCNGPDGFNCSFCADRRTIIASKQICDDRVDCPDLLDECLCLKNTNAIKRVDELCESICVEDKDLPCLRCPRGSIYCKEDEKCISRKQLCDFVVDCPISLMDEKFCYKVSERSRNYTCQEVADVLVEEMKSIYRGSYLNSFFPKLARMCDGVIECFLFDDECSPECPNRMSQCDTFPLEKYGNITVRVSPSNTVTPGSYVCDGVETDSEDLDEKNCTKRHYCTASTALRTAYSEWEVVSIREKDVCDGKADCLDSSDEMNCSRDTHFYCCSGRPLFVLAADVKDGKQDCSDNSDECPLYYCNGTDNSLFASRGEMISWPFLRYLIWVMAFFALFGNVIVILEMCHYALTQTRHESQMGKCNHMLLCSLAVSDLLMGVVLATLGIKSRQFSGEYCENGDVWKTSSLCNGVGALSVMSAQTSVYTLALLTFYRLYGACQPFKSQQLNLKTVFALILLGWVINCLIAIVPFFPVFNQLFITHALMTPSPYFTSTKVSWGDIYKFAVRSLVLNNVSEISLDGLDSWSSVARFLERKELSDFAPKVRSYFGHYSTHGVCIPRMFRDSSAESVHPLATLTIVANFAGLVFILSAYCVICKFSMSAGKGVSSQFNEARKRRNKLMQWKITMLVGTYLLCWLPICIMSFVGSAGVPVPDEVYAVAAIVLLPINSSVDPFIYSNGFQLARNKLRKWRHGDQNQKKNPKVKTCASPEKIIAASSL